MSRRGLWLTAVVILAFAGGLDLAAGADSRSTPTSPLPDPLARRAAPLSQVVTIVVLVLVAVGALWLGRRRSQEEWDEKLKAAPPHLRLVHRWADRKHRRAPDFYEELRRREAHLDELQGEEREGRRRKIVEIRPGDGGNAGRTG